MLLQHKQTAELVEVNDITQLVNPSEADISAQSQHGEEKQDPARFGKAELVFPSGESLPRCWVDPHYKNA